MQIIPLLLILLLLSVTTNTTHAATPSERCRLEPVKGPCKALIEAAYFDRTSGRCVPYFYDGCGAVKPFDSLEQCQAQCEPAVPDEQPQRQGGSGLKRDPIEADPRYRKIFAGIELEVDQAVAGDPRRGSMGFVHLRWEVKKRILKQNYGIEWRSPAELNPHVMFD